MFKKLYITIISIVLITFTILIMNPLSNMVDSLTAEIVVNEEIDIILEDNKFLSASAHVTIFFGYYNTWGESYLTDLDIDLYDSYLLNIPPIPLDYTPLSTTYNNSGAENSYRFYVRYFNNVGSYPTVYFEIKNFYEEFNLSNSYAVYNETLIREGFTISLDNLLNVISNNYPDFVRLDRLSFGISLVTPVTNNPLFIDYLIDENFKPMTLTYNTPAQITGVTARLLTLIPFILIAGIVVFAVITIKKGDD